MGLSRDQKEEIKKYLLLKIRNKIETYSRETTAMPFHSRLFGENRMATYSFIQSCNTMLGQSIFEQIGEIIAKPHFLIAKSQYKEFNGNLSDKRVIVIDHIMKDLTSGIRNANKDKEIIDILKTQNTSGKKISQRVDLYLKDKNNLEYLIELKTAKPNINEFTSIKRKLLEWTAISNKPINTLVCIPYNPYFPERYQRWTLKGLFDINKEILVGEEFWDFLGGNNTFNELLDIFTDVGKIISPDIDVKVEKIAKTTK